jgi:hypothetical protein
LQLTPRFLQFIASRSLEAVPLPTVQVIATNQTKGPIMKTVSTQARIVAAISALVMSSAVLGGTVTAMQSSSKAEAPVILMERVVITAPAVS